MPLICMSFRAVFFFIFRLYVAPLMFHTPSKQNSAQLFKNATQGFEKSR